MLEDLDVLAALSHQDAALADARRAVVEMPAKLAAIDQRLADLKKAASSAHDALEATRLARRARERETQELESEARRLDGQLVQIKTNDAYKAMLREIEHAKEKRSAVETDILELMDREERQTGELKEREAALAGDTQTLRAQRAALEADLAARTAKVAEVQVARAGLIGRLSPSMRPRYERVFASKGGNAVALVAKVSCGGCHTNLPPQVLAEVKRRDALLVCEACGRILVWEGA